MKAASWSILLSISLVSSLAQAADGDVRLRLRDPAWADTVTPGMPSAEESHVPLQVGMGLAGALLLTIPGAYAGYQIGDRRAPAERSCDQAGCDTLFPYGGALGLVAGGFVGLVAGTGLGVATAGVLVKRPFHLAPAIGGAALGGFLGLLAGTVVSIAIAATLAPILPFLGVLGAALIPGGLIAGAVAGAIWLYEDSFRSRPVKVAPTVALVPGGGMAGIAGTLF
jgi:hypothetical protein